VRLAEPVDQATGLRRLFTPETAFHAVGVLGPDERSTARLSAALALALRRRGGRVLVLDAARPPHSAGGFLGLLPRYGLADAPRRGVAEVVQVAQDGIMLLSAQNGLATLASLSEQALLDMADDWKSRLEAPEWLVVNGATRPGEVGLAETADVRILVLTGGKAHLAEAYATMKSAHTTRPGKMWWVMTDGAEAEQAQGLFTSLSETAQRFLGIAPRFLGNLPRQRAGIGAPGLDLSQVDALAGEPAAWSGESSMNFEQYWQRMWLYSRMTAEAATTRVQNVRWRSG
jgi:hypothetical protein